jgi:hypothetical protein
MDTWLFVGMIAVLALIGLFIQAGFLLLGARIVNIYNRSFGKAMGITILGGIASTVLSALLGVIPEYGRALGIIGGFLISMFITMAIFKTTFGKALGATVLAWVMGIVVIGGIVLLGGILMGGFVASRM